MCIYGEKISIFSRQGALLKSSLKVSLSIVIAMCNAFPCRRKIVRFAVDTDKEKLSLRLYEAQSTVFVQRNNRQ